MPKSLNISSSIFAIEMEGPSFTRALCIPVQFETVQLARTIYLIRKWEKEAIGGREENSTKSQFGILTPQLAGARVFFFFP